MNLRTILSTLTLTCVFLTSCGGGGSSGGGSSGGDDSSGGGTTATFDPRLIGRWEFQEILGAGGSFTLINVEQLTFASDFTGFQVNFSVANGSVSPKVRVDFTWAPLNATAIRVTATGGSADGEYAFTTDGSGMKLDGRVYSRLD